MKTHASSLARCALLALAGSLLLLMVVAAKESLAASDGDQRGYLRLKLPPKTNIYVEISETELRMATTPAALKTAKVIKPKAREDGPPEFPPTALPVPASALPAGFIGAQVAFSYYAMPDRRGADPANVSCGYSSGRLGLTRKDSKGVNWTYWIDINEEVKNSPVNAPVIQVPAPKKLLLRIDARPDGKQVGIGLKTMAVQAEVSNIQRNGKDMEAQIQLIDSAGKAVTTAKGPLSKFGFG